MPRVRIKRGGGTNPTGGGLKRAGSGCGRKRRVTRRGGSMRHLKVPPSVRRQEVAKLKKIVSSAKTGKSRGSVVKKIKSWAVTAQKLAKKYDAASKAASVARLGYRAYQLKKGRSGNVPRIAHSAPALIVD